MKVKVLSIKFRGQTSSPQNLQWSYFNDLMGKLYQLENWFSVVLSTKHMHKKYIQNNTICTKQYNKHKTMTTNIATITTKLLITRTKACTIQQRQKT